MQTAFYNSCFTYDKVPSPPTHAGRGTNAGRGPRAWRVHRDGKSTGSPISLAHVQQRCWRGRAARARMRRGAARQAAPQRLPCPPLQGLPPSGTDEELLAALKR